MSFTRSAFKPSPIELASAVPSRIPARESVIVPGTNVNALARGWFVFALASLLVSGVFALLLVVGRVPPFSGWISDPAFFRRCLVLHVNLSLIVWFCAYTASLFALLPCRRNTAIGRTTLVAAASGALAMIVSAFVPGTVPVLSNYIPFVDHPLFIVGIGIFFLGTIAFYLSGSLVPQDSERGRIVKTGPTERAAFRERKTVVPPEAAAGIRTAAAAFLIAMVTFAASWAATSPSLPREAYYELTVWGGGHVLQVANVAAMVAIWLLLTASVCGRPAAGAKTAGILFALLLLPHLASPLLTLEGTSDVLYHRGFTRLMQFGIFPVVSVFLVLCTVGFVRARSEGMLRSNVLKDFRVVGLAASVVLTVAGFVLGAMIRGNTTMIPAHYHASIGAVTVAFMAGAYLLADAYGLYGRRQFLKKFAPVQLVLFGGGQFIFAMGFALGGAFGLDRKVYGADQHVYSIWEYVGLGMMGAGGLVAVGGGVLFLVLMVLAIPRRSIAG